ncbi:acyl carrier protein [Bacteroidota bacterium]
MKVNEFLDAICRALSREPGTLTLDDTNETVEEWDSLGHLAIISIVDSEFGVPPETEDLQTFTSLRELADVLVASGALEEDL